MKAALYTAALLVALVFVGRTAVAGEVTLKGKMVCGKCTLNETKECTNVLLVDEKGKQVKYYLTDNALSKKNHDAVCSGEAPRPNSSQAQSRQATTAANAKRPARSVVGDRFMGRPAPWLPTGSADPRPGCWRRR